MEYVTATEFQNNVGSYLKRSKEGEDFAITSYGKIISTLSSKVKQDALIFDSIIGCIDVETDLDNPNKERMKKYESLS